MLPASGELEAGIEKRGAVAAEFAHKSDEYQRKGGQHQTSTTTSALPTARFLIEVGDSVLLCASMGQLEFSIVDFPVQPSRILPWICN